MRVAGLPPLSKLGEFGLIRYLGGRFGRTSASVLCGIGDDAAIVQPLSHRELLVTTDLLVEGIHFQSGTASFADIGYKAAVANLSDIAAMGGSPDYILVSLAIPPQRTTQNIDQLYHGLMEACRREKVDLIGGDTSASHQALFIGVTLIGSAKPGHALRRTGARAGDLLYVSGTLGDSLAGLSLIENQRGRGDAKLPREHRRYLVGRHLRPTPRLRLGRILSSTKVATSAIDISDGLGGDLSRLCEASAVGAEIDQGAIPCSAACRAYAALSHIDPIQLALRGGEDYELLFTVAPRHARKVKQLARQAKCPVTCVGVVKPKAHGIQIRQRTGILKPLNVQSYEHFQNTKRPAKHR
jgi:thiamine-monophosphate kinase